MLMVILPTTVRTPLPSFSTSNLNFNASVQNRNDTGGDLNLVAGWDGSTTFDAAVFDAQSVNTAGTFGGNNGSINIGNGSQARGIAVGEVGENRAFAYDLNIQGGAVRDVFAQLGFRFPIKPLRIKWVEPSPLG